VHYKSNDAGQLLDLFFDVVNVDEGEGGDEVEGEGDEEAGEPLEQNTVDDDESMVVTESTTTTMEMTTSTSSTTPAVATAIQAAEDESVEPSDATVAAGTDEVEKEEEGLVENTFEPTSSTSPARTATTTFLADEEDIVETTTATTTMATSAAVEEVDISIYSTSYPCTASSYVATAVEENKRIKQLIQFDYDLVLSSTSTEEESSNDINSILRQFEEQLLDHVGLALDDVGLCGGSGSGSDAQRERVRRMVRGANDDGVTTLEEISSLPMDEVLASANATCSEEDLPSASSTSTSTTTCYPIGGYMTAYYHNATTETTADDIELAIYDIIQRGMMESTNINTLTTNSNNMNASVHFVGVRGTSLEESQLGNPSYNNIKNNDMIFNPNTKPQPSSELLIGTIIGGLLAAVAVLVLAFVAVRRAGHCKGTRGTDDNGNYDNDLHSDEGTSQDEDAKSAGEMMHIPPISMIVSPSYNAGVPSYNTSNDVYCREEEQQRQRQQHQWLSRSLTSETDMTPVVSNVGRSRHQRNVAASHLAEQTIQECDDDDEESEW